MPPLCSRRSLSSSHHEPRFGHVAINAVPMATNQGFKSFIPKPEQADASFLYHWLRANRPFLESLGNGATFKEVSKAVVSRIEIRLPSVGEQRRLADLLDKADAIRCKRKDGIALAERLLRSLFLRCLATQWRTQKDGRTSHSQSWAGSPPATRHREQCLSTLATTSSGSSQIT